MFEKGGRGAEGMFKADILLVHGQTRKRSRQLGNARRSRCGSTVGSAHTALADFQTPPRKSNDLTLAIFIVDVVFGLDRLFAISRTMRMTSVGAFWRPPGVDRLRIRGVAVTSRWRCAERWGRQRRGSVEIAVDTSCW
ncbi:hypothetical protein MRB53_040506 [Persea americana]|nr:hypothetical protein MRB53_040506 [Persea americana]